jgi:predicted dinucleotide-binding enzyme
MPENDQAIDRAGVLVSAVWLDAFQQLIAQCGERPADKVIVGGRGGSQVPCAGVTATPSLALARGFQVPQTTQKGEEP